MDNGLARSPKYYFIENEHNKDAKLKKLYERSTHLKLLHTGSINTHKVKTEVKLRFFELFSAFDLELIFYVLVVSSSHFELYLAGYNWSKLVVCNKYNNFSSFQTEFLQQSVVSLIKIFLDGPDKNRCIRSFTLSIATYIFHTTIMTSMTMCDGHLRTLRSINWMSLFKSSVSNTSKSLFWVNIDNQASHFELEFRIKECTA